MAPSARRVRRGLAGVGLGAVGLAALLVVAPRVVPPRVRRLWAGLLSGVPGEPLLWGLALVAGFYALVRVATGRSRPAVAPDFEEPAAEESGTGPLEAAGAGSVPPVGTGFDRAVDRAAAGAGDPREAGRAVRERLRATATAVLARRTDRSTGEARAAVAAGEWTDDRVAAAFLGGDRAPNYTIGERVRGWIRPARAFEERTDRTVAAVAAVADGSEGATPESGGDDDPSGQREGRVAENGDPTAENGDPAFEVGDGRSDGGEPDAAGPDGADPGDTGGSR